MRDAPLATAFGEILSAARQEAGLTQESLAHLAGLDRTAISQLERGEAAPRLESIVRLAGALNIDPCALIPAIRWKPPAAPPAPQGRFVE